MGESTTSPDDVTIRPLTEADLPTLRSSSRAAVSDMRNRLGLSPLPPLPPPDPSAGPSTGDAIVRQLLRL
ncbi:MAG TPA: hypothetical protein VH442_10820, partial [Micromonosporaceae bacterium]